MYGLALAILKNQHEAEDLTQEVFLMLCSSTAFDAERGSLRAFLTTVVRSRAIDRFRHAPVRFAYCAASGSRDRHRSSL